MKASPSGPKGRNSRGRNIHLTASTPAPKHAGSSPPAVAKRKQAQRKEQQRQEDDVAAAHDEHDHGDRKTDSKETHQNPFFERSPSPGYSLAPHQVPRETSR
jgi:hypothetical protein